MNCTQDLFYCFSSSRMFCSDLLGAVCLLNFARRTAHESSAFHPRKCKMHKFYKMYKVIFFFVLNNSIFSVFGGVRFLLMESICRQIFYFLGLRKNLFPLFLILLDIQMLVLQMLTKLVYQGWKN